MEYTNEILSSVIENDNLALFESANNIVNISKVACAMANASGGIILVGISDNKNIVGISKDEVSMVIKTIQDVISPVLPFTYNVLQEFDKSVLLISIWAGGKKPYVTNGSFYVRVGDIVSKADKQQADELFEERFRFDNGWERQNCLLANMEDISNSVYNQLKSNMIEMGKVEHDADCKTICKYLGFLHDGALTNGCVTVMCNHPTEYLSQLRIRLSIFGEHDELISVRIFEENLVGNIDAITDAISALYPSKMEINSNQRHDFEVLPKIALREGLLNACVHRDYSVYNSFIAVNLYADRVEITNSGELPIEISIDTLSKRHHSVLRNPDIANAFFILKYIEMAGSGTQRILSECSKNKCEKPYWKSEDGMVTLTFPKVYHCQQSSMKKDWSTIVEHISIETSVRDSLLSILQYMNHKNFVKLQELMEVTNKSYPMVKRYMQLLKDANIIEYEGSNRTGGWKIK